MVWLRPSGDRLPEQLLHALGSGITALLREQVANALARAEPEELRIIGCEQADVPPTHLLLKTPYLRNLAVARTLFPSAPLLLLVRDGRSVVASGTRGIFEDPEYWMQTWAAGARELLRFTAEHPPERDRSLVVRYEDLYARPRQEMFSILRLVGLDESKYDFDAAAALPVTGSSFFGDRRHPRFQVALEKTDEFQPVTRFASWSSDMHARFGWVAGRESGARLRDPLIT